MKKVISFKLLSLLVCLLIFFNINSYSQTPARTKAINTIVDSLPDNNTKAITPSRLRYTLFRMLDATKDSVPILDMINLQKNIPNGLAGLDGAGKILTSQLPAETDPNVPSWVKAITSTDITNWNTAFGWGNHATAGYLVPIVTSPVEGQVLKYISGAWRNSSASNTADSTTASNGLSLTGKDVQLGGTLIKNTTIDGAFQWEVANRMMLFHPTDTLLLYSDANPDAYIQLTSGKIELGDNTKIWNGLEVVGKVNLSTSNSPILVPKLSSDPAGTNGDIYYNTTTNTFRKYENFAWKDLSAMGDAAADGVTKGVATFASNDFNSSGGLISLDYTNMQVGSGSQNGIITPTLYNLFTAVPTWDQVMSSGDDLTSSPATTLSGTNKWTITGGSGTLSGTIEVSNTSSGSGVKGSSTNGYGLEGSGGGGGIFCTSNAAPGLFAQTYNNANLNAPIWSTNYGRAVDINNTLAGLDLFRNTVSGVPGNGSGLNIRFFLMNNDGSGSTVRSSIDAVTTTATPGSYASDLIFKTTGSGTLSSALTLKGGGQLVANQYNGTNFQSTDTTTYKPIAMNTSGAIVRMGNWVGGGTGNNFANADLTFTGNRTHDAANHNLTIQNLGNTTFASSGNVGTATRVNVYMLPSSAPFLYRVNTAQRNSANSADSVFQDFVQTGTHQYLSSGNITTGKNGSIWVRSDGIGIVNATDSLLIRAYPGSGANLDSVLVPGIMTPIGIGSAEVQGLNAIYKVPKSSLLPTFNNGLTLASNTVKFGGTLSQNTTINTGGFTTTWTGSNDNQTSFAVTNTGTTNASAISGTASGTTSIGVSGTSSSYLGVYGTSTSGTGIQGQSSSGVGIIGVSSTGAALRGQNNPTSTNAIENILTLLRTSSSGAGANGIGSAIQFELETATNGNSQTAGSIAFLWSDATSATRTSRFEVYGTNSATTARKMAVTGTGQLILDGYGTGTNTGTTAYALGVDASGNVIEFSASGSTPTIEQVLTSGSTFSNPHTLVLAGNAFDLTSSQASVAGFSVTNSGNGSAASFSTNGTGTGATIANSSTGNGLTATATSGFAINATTSSGGLVFRGKTTSSTTNTVIPTFRTIRSSSGTPAIGAGNEWQMQVTDDSGNDITVAALKAVTTGVTSGSVSGDLQLFTINSGSASNKLTVKAAGQIQHNSYGSGTFTGTAATYPAYDASGNIIEYTKQSFAQTATVTFSGTNTETTLVGSGAGSLTIPSSAFVVGKTYRVTLRGYFSTDAGGSVNITYRLKLGSVTIASVTVFNSANLSNRGHEVVAMFTVHSTGASGTIMTMGMYHNDNSGTTTKFDNAGSTSTIDMTSNQTLDFTGQFGNTNAGNSISAYVLTLESVN